MSDLHEKVRDDVMIGILALQREAVAVYERVVMPDAAAHGYAETLYGYVGRVFSYVDLLSAYWGMTPKQATQTDRMIAFLEKYMRPAHREHKVAIQIWRQTLFHTARPRAHRERGTGKVFRYLIQWTSARLPDHQPHGTTVPFGSASEEVLNLALFPLIDDLKKAAERFFDEVAGSPDLQRNLDRHEASLAAVR